MQTIHEVIKYFLTNPKIVNLFESLEDIELNRELTKKSGRGNKIKVGTWKNERCIYQSHLFLCFQNIYLCGAYHFNSNCIAGNF